MARRISNMNDLQKALQPVMTKMVDQLAERVYETLNFFLNDYYTGWTPKSYRRTEAFLRSAVKVDAHSYNSGVKAIELFRDTLMEYLAEGNVVNFYGIGNFKMKMVKGREAGNPKTGEPCIIPDRKKVKFYPNETLTDKIENE